VDAVTNGSSKSNTLIAEQLREIAALLEHQEANRFRVAAYRKAAECIKSLPNDIALIFRTEGFQGLTSLPGIGTQIGGTIAEIIRTGQSSQLERLRGTLDPEALLGRVPGIGPRLARRILDELHIDSLEGLESAAYDGRLDQLAGFGPRRLAMVRASLAELLGRSRYVHEGPREPSIDILLDVDQDYRKKAAANELRRIAPKRFNPTNEAWLPILHIEINKWQLTVLFSNTALAQSLGRTQDWVVIYFQSDFYAEGQQTVVTETHGSFRSKRVVRGRETECIEYYRSRVSQASNVA
jgi:putative hydrolase